MRFSTGETAIVTIFKNVQAQRTAVIQEKNDVLQNYEAITMLLETTQTLEFRESPEVLHNANHGNKYRTLIYFDHNRNHKQFQQLHGPT